jgi:hypothetical protein
MRPPLSAEQKNAIKTLTKAGWNAVQIADNLGIGEGQVAYWRVLLCAGAKGSVKATRPPLEGRRDPLRPRHARGEVGSGEWFASCEDAFQVAMRYEMAARAAESEGFQRVAL